VADARVSGKSLPSTGPLDRYLRAQASLSERAFVSALPGAAVLVRVDERGGADETAPWAVPLLEHLPVPRDDGGGDDVFIDIGSLMTSVEATATGPAQPPLPLPRAREHATVHVVPTAGGSVGRAATVAVRIPERSISREHAVVACHDDGWSITDLDSSNGTGVNGMPLLPGEVHRLRSGDVIQLADVVFVFLDAAAFCSHLPALAGG
jgi:hypothetical protein